MGLKWQFALVLLCIALLAENTLAASKDRHRKKNKNRSEEANEDDEGRHSAGGLGLSEDKRKETKDRVKDLVEREEERKERHEKKEESSEEKDDEKEKDKNSTEIHIPSARLRRDRSWEPKAHSLVRHRRQEHSLKRTSEINDGQQTALHSKPKQDHQCGPDCKHSRVRRIVREKKHEFLESPSIRSHDRYAELQQHSGKYYAPDYVLDDDEPTSRVKRAKAGKKDIGHRTATHPHTNKRTGIKAGRRRGQNNAASGDGNKEGKGKSRNPRRVVEEEWDLEPVGDIYIPSRDRIRQKARIVWNPEVEVPKPHRGRRGGIFPEDPKSRESTGRNQPTNDEGVIVAADAASITDY